MNDPKMDRFATTQWSLVNAAGHGISEVARAAMGDLCQIYWFPVYAYIRRNGNSSENAEDLTQAFFVHLLESDFVKSVDRNRGRFRSYLLKSVSNFVTAEHRSQQSQKRGGSRIHLSLDFESGERSYRELATDSMSADQLFERRWAETLLQNARTKLRLDYEAHNHGKLFEMLEPHLNQDATRVPYAQLSPALNMSEDAIKQAARRLKLRFREFLRAEIANTVETIDQVDQELSYLINVLSNDT